MYKNNWTYLMKNLMNLMKIVNFRNLSHWPHHTSDCWVFQLFTEVNHYESLVSVKVDCVPELQLDVYDVHDGIVSGEEQPVVHDCHSKIPIWAGSYTIKRWVRHSPWDCLPACQSYQTSRTSSPGWWSWDQLMHLDFGWLPQQRN